MNIILHIVYKKDWKQYTADGYYKPRSLEKEGFIHCSTLDQTVETANQFYSKQQGLLLLCIDEKKIEAEIKYENPAYEKDQRFALLFPHIYGPLNVSSIIEVLDFEPNQKGKFELPTEVFTF